MKPPENKTSEFTPADLGRLIELRLKARLSAGASSKSATPHPNEDLINAFVEGELGEAESHYLVSHLVECATCLHLTTELTRHEQLKDGINSPDPIPGPLEEQPGPLQGVIDSFANAISPRHEDAVFAYQEPEEAQRGEDDENPKGDP